MYDEKDLCKYVENVLQMEAVACKDYLTNKADRCGYGKSGHVSRTSAALHLPLSDCGRRSVGLQRGGTALPLR